MVGVVFIDGGLVFVEVVDGDGYLVE